ncbi:aldehyde dehydrogenase family protein, partial [Escherichia coli]|nr:aldehyde dehydrogenase family protein [Escherichia coli]
SGILERHAILRKTADEITARKDEIGRLLSREEGKTLAEGIGETVRAAQIFDFFAGEVLRLAGEVLPSARPNIGVEVTREAVGVVGIITPWNFPIAIPAWKIAPALAYGNTVVFKPSEQTPLTALKMARLLADILPEGVVNVILGRGDTVGNALINHPKIGMVSITGDIATGKKVLQAAAKTVKRTHLELGGKAPVIV